MPGVLRAKVDGNWVDIGIGAVDEVFVGPTAPTDTNVQLWYDTDAPAFGMVEYNTYVPTLGVIAIGTGGSALNEGAYTFVGGPSVGDRGILAIQGRIIFGTTTPTFPG